LAVETGYWLLYEIDDGRFKITYKIKRRLPISKYLKVQGRLNI
jgi:pyruvate ferredoxin oxidoreductase beta subunit